MRIENRIEVAANPSRVFAYLADIRNEPRWNSWGKQVEMLTPVPIGQGSRFRGTYKRMGVVEQELATYEPDRRLVYASDAMGGAGMTFELSPAESGTQILLIGEAQLPGVLRVVEPLMAMMMRRHFQDLALGLKRELNGV
jgi:uncharacterized protein YndB with AHSA1/START domain